MSSSLWITIEVRPGSNIPARVIPEIMPIRLTHTGRK